MEQQENYQATPGFGNIIVSALVHFLHMLAFVLFICPFSFWKGATIRLYRERQSKHLTSFTSNSRWPFLSFIKILFFGFLIDGSIFFSYILGILVAFVVLFNGGGFIGFIGALIIFYYAPVGLSLFRDLCTLFILQFQKFLSWLSKPAQQLDLDIHNH